MSVFSSTVLRSFVQAEALSQYEPTRPISGNSCGIISVWAIKYRHISQLPLVACGANWEYIICLFYFIIVESASSEILRQMYCVHSCASAAFHLFLAYGNSMSAP